MAVPCLEVVRQVPRGNSMPRYHVIHGLYIESDLPLSDFQKVDDVGVFAVHSQFIKVQKSPNPLPLEAKNSEGSWLTYYKTDDELLLIWNGHFSFRIQFSKNTIHYQKSHSVNLDFMVSVLLSTVLSCFLVRKNIEPLHGSVLSYQIDGIQMGIMILGQSGYGKSTLCAGLTKCNWQLVSDDMIHLQKKPGGYVCLAGPALLKLYPDSLNAVLRPDNSHFKIKDLSALTEKKLIQSQPDLPHQNSQPVNIDLVLQLNDPESESVAALTMRQLPISKAYFSFLENIFNLIDLNSNRMTQIHKHCADWSLWLINYQLSYPRSYQGFADVCQQISHQIISIVLEKRRGLIRKNPSASLGQSFIC